MWSIIPRCKVRLNYICTFLKAAIILILIFRCVAPPRCSGLLGQYQKAENGKTPEEASCGQAGANLVCCDPLDIVSEEDNDVVQPPSTPCGKRNTQGLAVFKPQDGVQTTKAGEWPFACLLKQKDFDGSRAKTLGGATLIAPGILVTAAHKLEVIVEGTKNDTRPKYRQVIGKCYLSCH